MSSGTYVLITPARNEEACIEITIKAVLGQRSLPGEWVIVSDGSTDRTDEIVTGYLQKHKFIRLFRRPQGGERDFASKVHAFNMGYHHLCCTDYEFIGNLDADVSFDCDYYDRMLDKFRTNVKLGIAGGFIYEKWDREFKSRSINRVRSVAGAVQLFRRECFEAIGSFPPLKYGLEDTWAEVMARMVGWKVESFPDIKVFHHRRTGSSSGKLLKAKFREGIGDFALGNHPIHEALRCLRLLRERPYLLGGLFIMTGFIWGFCLAKKGMVSQDFVRYLRNEQMDRIRRMIRTGVVDWRS